MLKKWRIGRIGRLERLSGGRISRQLPCRTALLSLTYLGGTMKQALSTVTTGQSAGHPKPAPRQTYSLRKKNRLLPRLK